MMAEGLVFREKGIYRLANAGLLAGVALFGGEQILGVGSLTAWQAAGALVVLGLLAGVNFLPLRGKFICLSAVALGVGVAVSAAGIQESLLFLRGYFPWLMGTGEGYGEWAGGYGLLQTAIIVAACYLLQIFFEKMPRLKIFFAALLLAGAVFQLLRQRDVPHWGMAFGICFVVTVYVECAEGRWKKVRGGSRKAYMLRIMPFLAVYLLLMGCMPAPETPFEWRWVKSIYHQLRESILVYTQRIKWGSREGFNMAFTGFSEEPELGGDLQDKAEVLMTVQLLNTASENVYLTGTVYDTFDGRQWRQTYRGGPRDMFLDTAETLGAVRAFDEQYQSDYLYGAKIRISYQDFNTQYVFAPLKTREVKGEEEAFAYICEGGSLRLEQYQGYGTTYELQYFQMNSGQEEFYRFLEEYSEEVSALPENMLYTDQAIWEETGVEEIAEHRRGIYENYLGEVTLSERAADYLVQITEGAETDVEKLRAIERELSSFVYTRTPGNLPEWVRGGSEFLDYFLLDSRQGYCTYFATAFVLLARAEGIPARYVQGFCVPTQGTRESYVYSNMAHAWPEAYIQGVGWIPFEPTPGYGGIRFASWELKKPDAAEVDVSGGEDQAGDAQGPGGELWDADEQLWTEEAPESDTTDGEERTGHLWRALRYAVPGVLAGYVLLLLLDNIWNRHRYRRMGPEEKFKLEVSRNIRLLALLGMERGERETLQELGDRCRPQTGIEAVRFIEYYENVVYGGRSVTEEMTEETVKERQTLLELLRQEKRWAYIRWQVRAYLIRYR